jgi:hypothetical protein
MRGSIPPLPICLHEVVLNYSSTGTILVLLLLLLLLLYFKIELFLAVILHLSRIFQSLK